MFCSKFILLSILAYFKKTPTSRRIHCDLFGYNKRSMQTWFDDVALVPTDIIFEHVAAYKRDESACKVNLCIGAYRDGQGEARVLRCVRAAEQRICARDLHKEYAPCIGNAVFNRSSAELALGSNAACLIEQRHVTVQTISGAGALRLGAAFLRQCLPNSAIYLPTPAWPNDELVFRHVGLPVQRYRYYNAQAHCFDLAGMLADLCVMPAASIVLLHEVAHNPTGADPQPQQWHEIAQLMKQRKLFGFFDMAYQGLASDSVERDAQAVRCFEAAGNCCMLAQSYSKNMGLYGEPTGALTLICASKDEAQRCLSQIAVLINGFYSNPPAHGARIVAEILQDDDLRCQWLAELRCMAARICDMRKQLRYALEQLGSTTCWQHFTQTVGMFCLTDLTAAQVKRLAKEFSVYLTPDGRISFAGLTNGNVPYVAECLHQVTK